MSLRRVYGNQGGGGGTTSGIIVPFSTGIKSGDGGQSNMVGSTGVGATWATPTLAYCRQLSNAGVYEPLTPQSDHDTGQIDTISSDTQTDYSSGYDFGKNAHILTGKAVTIVNRAKGSTSTTGWLPTVGVPLDRTRLHGSACYWWQQAQINLIRWYQGEKNAADATDGVYLSETQDIFNAFRTTLGQTVNPITAATQDIPIIMFQLASSDDETAARKNIRNIQRGFEQGSGEAHAMSGVWLVATHDLALRDNVHLDTDGQREIGRRAALLYAEKIAGYTSYNGMGPRVVSLAKPTSTTVTITCSRALLDFATKDDLNYWTLSDTNGNLPITNFAVSGTVVTLTVNRATAGTVTVNYQPPARATGSSARLYRTLRDSDGLVLPCFVKTV